MTKKTLPLLLFLLLLAGLLFYQGKLWIVSPDRTIYSIRGIDVSHHQGAIDWQLVAADDVRFAYIKATEANDVQDSLFEYNWRAAYDAGIQTGAYHYFSLAYPGNVQAQNFINTVPVISDSLPPVVDLEYVGNSIQRPSKASFQEELNSFIETVSKQYEKKPILYTTYDFYKDYLYPEYSGYDIWIRSIYSVPTTNIISNWAIWQYDPYGRVNGVPGFVDLNVMKSNLWNS